MCKKEWVVYATFQFTDGQQRIQTIFTNVIQSVIRQLKLSEADFTTEKQVRSILIKLPDNIQLTFHKKSKVVSHLIV